MGSPPGPGAGPKGPPPSENAGPGNFKDMLGRRLKEADKNNDGKLQKDEVSGPLAGIFEKADRNGDDEVDQAELGAIIESMREKLNNDGAGKVREKLKEKFGK